MNSSDSEPPGDSAEKPDANASGVPPDALGETIVSLGETTAESGGPSKRGDAEQWVGRRLGKYEVTDVLGVGGMGVVLKAYDTTIERDVAIKVLPHEVSADEAAHRRFLSEAKSAGKLSHPNTVTIYEIAKEDSISFIVMEVVPGGSADDYLEKHGAYSVADATRMIIQACNGLSAAHASGLVHRDIKPANLLLTQDGSVKISDFGLAKQTQSQTLQVTRAGQIIGTPYYMSPEQCESREVDARSDIYSLGATYYGLLTGKNPFADSGSVVQVMFAHCNAQPPDPRTIRSEVPAACAHIIERAMAKQPDQRYASTSEMCVDLEAVLAAMSGAGIELPSRSSIMESQSIGLASAKRRDSRSPWLWIGALATIFIIGVAAFAMRTRNPSDGGPTDPETASTNVADSAAVVAPPSGQPIRIGILHSLSGTMADSESPVVDAALLAISELNDAGGVLGRPVEAVVADGRSDPATFAREATRLIDEEQVCTVFGCWTSASRKTVVPIFEESDHLLVYPVQYEGIEESPNVVYVGAAPNQQIIPAVKWAFAFQNRRRFFLVGSDYVFPRVAHEIIKDQLDELGAEFAGEAFLPLGSEDVGSIVKAIQDARPDMILNTINGDSNSAFFAELRKQGITPIEIPTISFSIGEAELRQLDAESMTGDFAAWNYFQSIDSEENHRFVAGFQERYGPQRVVTDPMEAEYFGIKLWAKAVEEAGSSETRAIRRAMRNQRMRAPSGDVRIDPETQHTFKTPRIGRVKRDGQFEIVWTDVKPELPVPYPPSRSTEQWKAFLHDLYTRWNDQWSAPEEP